SSSVQREGGNRYGNPGGNRSRKRGRRRAGKIGKRQGLRRPIAPRPLVVVDGDGTFYPPAAIALGIPADRLIVLRPTSHGDMVWAIDQALRCPDVAAVWAGLGAWLDDRDARRFQLAAESGGTVGLMVRPAAVIGRPTFADVRFHVQGAPRLHASNHNGRSLRVTIARCRGGRVGQSAVLHVSESDGRLIPLRPSANPLQPAAGGANERFNGERANGECAVGEPSPVATAHDGRRDNQHDEHVDGQRANEKRRDVAAALASKMAVCLATELAHPTSASQQRTA
ncbi:MAG: hypothetical protein AAFP69_23050, partial [Planctomycetota bacterium]